MLLEEKMLFVSIFSITCKVFNSFVLKIFSEAVLKGI